MPLSRRFRQLGVFDNNGRSSLLTFLLINVAGTLNQSARWWYHTRAFAPWACFRTSRQNIFNVTKRKLQASVSFCVSKTKKNNVLIESSANIWDEYRSTNLLKVMTLEIGNQEIGMRPVNRWHVSLLWPLDGPNTCFSSKNKHRSNKLIAILCRAGLNFGHTQNVCMNCLCEILECNHIKYLVIYIVKGKYMLWNMVTSDVIMCIYIYKYTWKGNVFELEEIYLHLTIWKALYVSLGINFVIVFAWQFRKRCISI